MLCSVLCVVAFDFLWITRHALGYLLFLLQAGATAKAMQSNHGLTSILVEIIIYGILQFITVVSNIKHRAHVSL